MQAVAAKMKNAEFWESKEKELQEQGSTRYIVGYPFFYYRIYPIDIHRSAFGYTISQGYPPDI